MRPTSALRAVSITATVRAAAPTSASEPAIGSEGRDERQPQEEGGRSHNNANSDSSANDSRSRSRGGQRGKTQQGHAERPSHSSLSSSSSPPSFVKGYTSSVPHHQSQGRGGCRTATLLMQRERNASPYYYHTVALGNLQQGSRARALQHPAVPGGGRAADVVMIVSNAPHSAFAMTGRRVESTAAALLSRGLSVADESVPAVSPSQGFRVLDYNTLHDGAAAATAAHGITALPTSSPAEVRTRRYEPFDWLFDRYVERGFVSVPALVYHPEAPPPAVLLDRVLQHRTPCVLLTEQTLLAITHTHRRSSATPGDRDGSASAGAAPLSSSTATSATNAFVLQRVVATLRHACEDLYARPSVRTLLAAALLHEGLHSEACEVVREMSDTEISPALWSALVDAAAQAKLTDSQLLWRLLRVQEEAARSEEEPTRLTAAGEMHGKPTEDGDDARQPARCPSGPLAVRSSSLVRIHDDGVTAPQHAGEPGEGTSGGVGADDAASDAAHWVRLRHGEVAYAAEHYSGLNSATADDRGAQSTGNGQLRLHPSTYAYLGDATASMVFDKSRRKAARAARRAQHLDGRPVAPAAPAAPVAAVPAGADEGAEAEVVSLFPTDARGSRESAKSPPPPDETTVSEAERALLEKAAPAVVLGSSGIVYGLDARVAAQLMLRAGVSFGGQASPLLAFHILRRYLDSCHALRDEANRLQAQVAQQLIQLEASLDAQRLQEGLEAGQEGSRAGGAAGTRQQQRRHQQELADTIRLLRQQAETPLQGATPHPSPFLVFFKILREARDVVTQHPSTAASAAAAAQAPTLTPSRTGAGEDDAVSDSAADSAGGTSLPMVHWEMAWRYFQLLNRENPLWYLQIPEEASDLCFYALEVLCRGADPWMSLNVGRAASARHIVDGLDMALWLLHHLDASHHTQEAKDVTRKVFRWLLVDVGVHLHSGLHHHLVPVTRVLLRLGLQDELKVLYNAVLDNVFAFTEEFRDEFIHIMSDLVCPACSSILSETDAYAERVCGNCMVVVPPKDPSTIPSFQLSAAHVQQVRERRKAQRAKSRQRVYSTVGRLVAGDDSALSPAAALLHSKKQHQRRANRRPFDAAELFRQRILNVEAAPLLPGVSVSSEFALFPVPGTEGEGDGGASAAVLDVRAAMEESSRRLALQRVARQYALAQRGGRSSSGDDSEVVGGLYGGTQAALPSSAAAFSALDRMAAGSGASAGPFPATRMDGAWACVWCQEQNSAWSSRLQCTACGAETGPAAPWRQFAYAPDGDVMGEVRARIANAEDRPVDAVVAAYLLMLYRRTFLLKAVPHDQERIRQLIEKLCLLHERVLAAFTYTRFVPPPARRKDNNLLLLAQMFGGASTAAFQQLTREDVQKDEVLFQAVFTPATCKVCFGTHDWRVCPIITRDFASSQRPSINLSPEEKQKAILEHLQRMVRKALEVGRGNSKAVVDAYASFVTSPFRELFAEVYAGETNDLSILLSDFRQYRRAAFVLCHVPLHARKNTAYTALCGYFNVTEAEAMQLLAKRSAGNVADDSHPNFVQVTMTCCMCLDQRHASFNCPRLHAWLVEVKRLAREGLAEGHKQLVDPVREQQTRRRLKAQVDGWTSAGPERLHAFYRFMLEHVDVLRAHHHDALFGERGSSRGEEEEPPAYRASQSDPLVYALNKAITKLAAMQQRSYACRLYARAPPVHVSQATTGAMLKLNRFSEDGIRALLSATDTPTSEAAAAAPLTGPATTASTARAAALPLKNRCLLCFRQGHAFFDCPELAAQATLADKLQYVMHQVGGISATADGITAAAAYVYHTYNRGLLSHELLRGHPAVVREMLVLAHRCFAVKELAAGVRVLRRIPVEMAPPEHIYLSLWRSAGLPEAAVESRRIEMLALFDAEGLKPAIDAPPPRRTYSAKFMSDLGHALHDDLCRHCFAHGHTLATCGVFHQEVGFGRDYVASYRMSMMSEQLSSEWQDAYLLKLVDFFAGHQYFMPYHIAGVANALNAIAAMWSFRGEPGIALAHLLKIPPAYRRRQAFKHVLHCLQVPTAEVSRVLANFYFSPDDAHALSPSSSPGNRQQQIVAQHLLMPKPAIRDVAMEAVFSHYPAAVAALEQSEQRMDRIRKRHQVPASASAAANAASPASSTSEMRSLLRQEAPREEDVVAAVPTPGPLNRSVSGVPSMQSGDITRLREDFDPILTELEDAVGMKLGSRHILFTSAIDVLSSNHTASVSSTSSAPASPAGAGAGAAATSPLAAAFAAARAAAATANGGGRGGAASAAASLLSSAVVTEAEIVSETSHQRATSSTASVARASPAAESRKEERSASAPSTSSQRQPSPPPPQQQQQQRSPYRRGGHDRAAEQRHGGGRRNDPRGGGGRRGGGGNEGRGRRQGGGRSHHRSDGDPNDRQ